jgi:Caspase domain
VHGGILACRRRPKGAPGLAFVPLALALALAGLLLQVGTPATAQSSTPGSGPSLASTLLTATDSGTVRALVVGIDRYRHVLQLSGAVADALDLAATLKREGVVDLTILLDEQVTRATLEKTLNELADRAMENDLIIITFAGHGAQEKSVSPDGKDEFFVLWGFDERGDATRERIVDKEMFRWLGRVAKKGALTIFLADVCFGGGMSKAVDPRVGQLPVRGLRRVDRPELAGRGAYYIDPREDRLPTMNSPAPDDDATKTYPSLTFISGVDDQHEAPEILIPGEATPRGAASYVLARGLQGQADAEGDRNGRTTRRELLSFVRRHVLMLSKDRQSPVGAPQTPESAEIVLFRHSGSPTASAPAPAIPAPELSVLLTAPDEATKVAAPPARTELVWDERTGDVLDQTGSVVAFAVPKAGLSSVVDRASAYQKLLLLAGGRALDMSITPIDRVFASGDKFHATLDGLYGGYLILLNLAGDGRVQHLFPLGNADPLMDKNSITIDFRAGEPFGTDTLIAITTKLRIPALELDLKLLDGKRSPLAMVQALELHLTPADRLGLGTYSTKPR